MLQQLGIRIRLRCLAVVSVMIELETLGPWGRSLGAVPNWRCRDGTWGNNVMMAPRATLVCLDWVLNDVGAVFTDLSVQFYESSTRGTVQGPLL